ncbi:hypothetical protein ACRB68_02910 [Actinomadura sp. RB68]|uniref:Uncharacterized protein n=1 Tax=Actinomadura macrotermitis TaxID=2585200 RepID=A0A7K0BM72_9ACTN|nr:hypothetical protein [Actinomadura macrotermitis]
MRGGGAARPAAPPRPEPRAPKAPAKRARRSGHRALYFGAALALGLAVALAAVLVAVTGGEDGKARRGTSFHAAVRPADSGPSPESYSSAPSTGVFAPIAQRAADGGPLTAEEAFPDAARTLRPAGGGARPALKGKRLDGECSAAVWGGALADDLVRAGCTQAARALYADTRAGYALSVTVFNLASAAEADRVVAGLGAGRGGGFVRPLPAPAPLDRFGRGYGMARGLAMGHYAVVSWAQRLDGKGDGRDETLLSLLIEGGKQPAVLGRVAAAH